MKRKVYMLTLVTLLASLLTGCLGVVSNVKEEIKEEIKEDIKEPIVVDEGRFKFSAPSGYEQMGADLSFLSPDRMSVVALNGVSSLGSGKPEELFEQFVEFYQGQAKELLERSDKVSEFTSIDGSQCFAGDLIIETTESTFNHTKVVMIPNKNLMISLTYQCGKEEKLDSEILENLMLSLEFTLYSQDEILGHTFVLPNNKSEFIFNTDGSVQYYKTENMHEDNYYDGMYEVFRGQAAIEALIQMPQYGYTEEELDRVLKKSMDNYSLMVNRDETTYTEDENGELIADTTGSYFVCEDSFYVVKITWKNSKIDGVEAKEEDTIVPFLGHYISELNSFDCLNLNTVSTQLWERQ